MLDSWVGLSPAAMLAALPPALPLAHPPCSVSGCGVLRQVLLASPALTRFRAAGCVRLMVRTDSAGALLLRARERWPAVLSAACSIPRAQPCPAVPFALCPCAGAAPGHGGPAAAGPGELWAAAGCAGERAATEARPGVARDCVPNAPTRLPQLSPPLLQVSETSQRPSLLGGGNSGAGEAGGTAAPKVCACWVRSRVA